MVCQCGGCGQRVHIFTGSGHDGARAQAVDLVATCNPVRPAVPAVCAPKRGGCSRRTGRRWPPIVIGKQRGLHGLAGLVAVGQFTTSASPPVACRCGSSYRSSGLRMGAKGRPAPSKRSARSCGAARPGVRAAWPAAAGPHTHAVVVGGQLPGSAFRSARPSTSQNDLPLRVAHRGQEDLLAVLHREHVVHGPGVVARGHRGRVACPSPRTAACAGPSGTRCSRTAPLCTSMPRPVMPRCISAPERADGAEQPAHDVVDAGACAQRVAGPAGHVGQAAHHLHHLVQRRAVFVRARAGSPCG
jgi:hypothetical protein